MSDSAELAEFFGQVGKLKEIERTGWVRSRVKKPESVADHSFRTALMAMILAERKGLDVEKAIKLALLHDVAESKIGDIGLHDKKRREKAEKERAAMKIILKKLGKQGEGLYKLWMEFEEGRSPEGKLVRALDKLEMVMQAAEYEKAQKIDLHSFIAHFEKHGPELPEDLQEMLDEIIAKRKH
jgi:putative hydrolase of HD superfamily